MTFKLTELPYSRDSAEMFSHFANEDWSIFLDSAYPYIDPGRYDIIAARPYITLKTFADETEIVYASGKREHSSKDPFSIVKSLLGERETRIPESLRSGQDSNITSLWSFTDMHYLAFSTTWKPDNFKKHNCNLFSLSTI